MSIPARNVKILVEKIQSLPVDQIVEVEHFVDSLRGRGPKTARKAKTGKKPFDFPVDDSCPWPDGLSLRREDMYGDDGR